MAMLLHALREGQPFVTYGSIKGELERRLGIPTIFPTKIGAVAGALMDDLLKIQPKAPLLNAIITRPNGMPGRGVAPYFARRYRQPELLTWNKIPHTTRLELVERERKRIFEYGDWERLAQQAYGSIPKITGMRLAGKWKDYDANCKGGPAESKEHRLLKYWVSRNPEAIGIPRISTTSTVEARLLSGDEVDVLFRNGTRHYVVEVKSRRSNEFDLERGIYQCVKYREVRLAEHAPFNIQVEAILVTEAPLPNDLATRAKLLGVTWRMAPKRR